MKKIVIILFTLSICLASGNIKKQMDDLMRSIQYKYQISGSEDLYKLKRQQTLQHGRTASRDMEDLVGDWILEEESNELFITVGTDQSLANPFSMMALVEAEGSITATASDYVAELTYLFDPSIMEGDDGGGDCDMNCEAEYDEYMSYGYDVSDYYCECCHEDYPIDVICEDDNGDSGGGGIEFEYGSVADLYANYGSVLESMGTDCGGCTGNLDGMNADTSFDINVQSEFENWANNFEFAEYYFQFIDENENESYDDGEIYAVSCEGDTSMTVAYDGSVYALQYEYFWMDAYDFDWESDDDDNEEREDISRNSDALTFAQDYVNDNSNDLSQNTFDLESEFSLVVDGNDVSGGLGGDDTENCEINWPTDPFKLAVYSFVSEYVLDEGASVGCFTLDDNLDQTYADFALDMENQWAGDDDDLPTAEDFLDWYDANGDGVLTLDEIINGINDSNEPLSSEDEEYIEYAFNDSDDNGDGVLDLDELENFIYMLENDDDDDNDDDGPDLMIMNMNFMEFFMVNIGMEFGMDLDSLNIENPTVLTIGSTNDDDNIDLVQGIMFVETGVIELKADSAEAVAAISTDTLDWSITIRNLSLYDSTGTAVLTVTGTIGPGSIDFIAGVEQAYPFLEGMEDMFGDGEDDYEAYMLFYEDSTGMEIEVEYYDDEYYDYPEIHIDTSYFSWSATSDSLFLYEDDDEYYEGELDTTEVAYFISSTDTLHMEASWDACEDEGSLEECLEFASEEIAGLDGLEDLQSLRISMQRVLTPGSYTAVDPGNGSLPQDFNLYANYPNPFNPVTTIRFDVGQNSGDNTLLQIYDITGRSVATLINGQLQTGAYEIQWDARGFASGIYFSELTSGTKRHTQKMVLLK